MTDAGGHDADVGDHNRPIWVTTMLRSTCPRWAETRTEDLEMHVRRLLQEPKKSR
jgi:hypothetical protein